MKYAVQDGNLRWTQGWTLLKKGDSFDEDHPIVLERPDLFNDEAPGAQFRTEGAPGRVESTMTSGPGSQSVRVEKPAVVKAPPRGSAQ